MEEEQERSQGSRSLFESLGKVGHQVEDDVFIWSQGLAFHYSNLLEALSGIEKGTRDKLLQDIWTSVAEKVPAPIKEKVGLTKPISVEKVGGALSQILSDKEHAAIKGSGKDINESILNWVRLFALLDFNIYMKLEHHIGTKDGYPMYMGLWEKFALAELDEVKKVVGITGPEDVDMDKIGELSKLYWETIACPYKVTQHSADIHEAEIQCCPYWDNMKELLGEEVSRSMTLKCEAAVSTNYYESILKAIGVFNQYSFTMDKFICCGDDVCRVRFEKRK